MSTESTTPPVRGVVLSPVLLLVPHIALVTVVLLAWELAARNGYVDPTFVGQPTGIGQFLWSNMVLSHKLWIELGWTLLGTFVSFVLGSIAAILTGLLFVSMPRLERFMDPYLTAFNAMPRIALAPLFILWFGLGVASKIAIGFSLAFFIVLSSTVAGMRSLNQDHVTLTKTLGASSWQMFSQVTLPSAVPVIFSGLRLGLIYAMLGVVGGEIIAAEHGLGQTLAYLGSTFNMNGVMALLLVLSLLGMSVTWSMTAIERRLLRWQ
ncbi:ABC transporter permease [Hydrogenophaga sp.]|uniref:ABC transporter permease n=1 Tax=Hydrogenophaga sp. TaxID=1904254 RepID=UPI002BD895B0|nr:ABC transporter permease [Hydrogenophaga sp.]HMP09503.1 ABC transporter permease [Hydrogenophaga sp.]